MARKSKYTSELLTPIVQKSFRWAELLRNLGLKNTGGNHRHIKSKVIALEIDTSHFITGSWNKGLAGSDDIRMGKCRIPDEEVFKENSDYKTSRLYSRLIRIGYNPICAECGISEWKERPLRLHVDHINGIHTDNRLENLRMMCPNCHSQTETYGYRNKNKLA